jgi:hypothetical protein
MLRRRSVAGFASDRLVMRLRFQFIYVIMTIGACRITGVGNLLRRYFLDRLRPVVSVFTESFRHQHSPGENQSRYHRHEQERQRYELMWNPK